VWRHNRWTANIGACSRSSHPWKTLSRMAGCRGDAEIASRKLSQSRKVVLLFFPPRERIRRHNIVSLNKQPAWFQLGVFLDLFMVVSLLSVLAQLELTLLSIESDLSFSLCSQFSCRRCFSTAVAIFFLIVLAGTHSSSSARCGLR